MAARPWPCSPPTSGSRCAGGRSPKPDGPGHDGDPRASPTSSGLLQAYAELLPAVNTLVGHHFTRTLVQVALDHVEQVGSRPNGRPSRPGGAGADPERTGAGAGDTPPVGATSDPALPDGPDADRPDHGRRTRPIGTSVGRRRPGRRGRPAHRCGEDGPGPVDVRRHRPPLRPGEPDDDLRARRPVADASRCPGPRAAARLARSSTWPAAPGTSSASWPRRAAARSGWTCRGGCWRPTTPGLPLAQADGSAPAAGDRVGGRDHLRLRPAQLHRSRRRLRRIRPGGPPGRPHQPPRGGRTRTRASSGPGHRIWFRRVVPLIGGLVSDAAAYRYLPRSTAYLPPTDELRSCSTGRFLGGQPAPPVGRAQPAHHRHPAGRP